MKKILTVVIPTYNMEKYISKTLDSLICKKECMDLLEVLVIDDGSKDGSAAIAKKYEEQYPDTFKVISKENGGHGSALNVGIDMATGKYFRPLDADDWVDTAALEYVIEVISKFDADMILTNFCKVYEKSDKVSKIRCQNVWNMREIRQGLAVPKEGRKKIVYGAVYDFNKELYDYAPLYLLHFVSYKTSILKDNGIRFTEKCFYDDMEYNLYPLPYVKTVLPIDRFLYQYRLEREGQSVEDAGFIRNRQQRKTIIINIIKYFKKHYYEFQSNVREYVRKDILWKIRRQYEIYLSMPVKKSTKLEMLEFDKELYELDEGLYFGVSTRRIDLFRKSKGKAYFIVANKFLKKIFNFFRKRNAPDPTKKPWTIAADKAMHRKIRRRKILKFLHLTWLSKDMRRIHRFKNIHKGERCFITCTGPSLTIKDLELLKNEYTFGVNSITKAYDRTDWRPTYYALIDLFAFGQYLKDNEVIGGSFCNRESFFHYRADPKTRTGRENFLLVSYANHKERWMKKNKIKYSLDPAVCVYDGFTVTNMAIQIAMYMGFKKIYILGADCDYTKGAIHFIEMPDDQKKIAAKRLDVGTALSINGYFAVKKFAEKHKCEIYNVTRGGKLEVFYRDNLERVLQEKK